MTDVEQEISNLTRLLDDRDNTIDKYEEEIYQLNKQLLLDQSEAPAKKASVKKASAKKSGNTAQTTKGKKR